MSTSKKNKKSKLSKSSKEVKPYRKKKYNKIFNLKNAILLGSTVGLGIGAKKIYDNYIKNLPNDKQIREEKNKRDQEERDRKYLEEKNKREQEKRDRKYLEEKNKRDQEERDRKYLEEKNKKDREELKSNSMILLKQLSKTKKEIANIDKLIRELQNSNVDEKEIAKDICLLYKIIIDKTLIECDKPFVNNKQYCIDRTNAKNNMDIIKVNKARKVLNCK